MIWRCATSTRKIGPRFSAQEPTGINYRPATVEYVLQRSGFATSYTPYQAEISHVAGHVRMPDHNASHYDDATSSAEAVLLALAASSPRRGKVAISRAIDLQWREVVKAYIAGAAVEAVEDSNPSLGGMQLPDNIDTDTAAVVVQSPNFVGQLDDLRQISTACRKVGALLIVAVDPIALGLFEPPGTCGADIVAADGQSLGLPPSFGGPSFGILAARKDLVRGLPGRLVGETTDAQGRRGYVLTAGESVPPLWTGGQW